MLRINQAYGGVVQDDADPTKQIYSCHQKSLSINNEKKQYLEVVGFRTSKVLTSWIYF